MMIDNPAIEPEGSINVFRSLIAELNLSYFTDSQLYDLAAIASESADGLCHGLLYLGEAMEKYETLAPEGNTPISAFLKATAHILPMLHEISEKANISIDKQAYKNSYQ